MGFACFNWKVTSSSYGFRFAVLQASRNQEQGEEEGTEISREESRGVEGKNRAKCQIPSIIWTMVRSCLAVLRAGLSIIC